MEHDVSELSNFCTQFFSTAEKDNTKECGKNTVALIYKVSIGCGGWKLMCPLIPWGVLRNKCQVYHKKKIGKMYTIRYTLSSLYCPYTLFEIYPLM